MECRSWRALRRRASLEWLKPFQLPGFGVDRALRAELAAQIQEIHTPLEGQEAWS